MKNLRKLAKRQLYPCLALLALISSGCVTVKEKTLCKVDGDLSAGGTCTRFIGTEIDYLTFEQMVELLHSSAIIMSAEDFNRWKTETEIMCRMLGNRCKYEVKSKGDGAL